MPRLGIFKFLLQKYVPLASPLQKSEEMSGCPKQKAKILAAWEMNSVNKSIRVLYVVVEI